MSAMMELTNDINQPACIHSQYVLPFIIQSAPQPTNAMPIVASENGSPAIFAMLKPFRSPPYRALFISILRSDGESGPSKPGIECQYDNAQARRDVYEAGKE